jgi:hypothetical protein
MPKKTAPKFIDIWMPKKTAVKGNLSFSSNHPKLSIVSVPCQKKNSG